MLSTDLAHLIIKTDYNLSNGKFEPTEIAEVTLAKTYRTRWDKNMMGMGWPTEIPVGERKELLYIACLNPIKNVLITGHPDPNTNEFVDPIELKLDTILKYTTLSKIK